MPGPRSRGRSVQPDRDDEQADGDQREHQGWPAVLGPGRAHRHIVLDGPRPAGSVVDPADRGVGVGTAHRALRAPYGTPVADGEADRGDQQPEHAGDTGHVLQRRDAEDDGQAAEHQPDETEPARDRARPGGDEDGEPGQADQGPQPRDGADPVVVDRGRAVVDRDRVVLAAGIMNSVSRPEPRIETTAVPASPTRATTGARLSPVVARSRRNSPAPKTIISTAPSAVIAWKANITPVLSDSASATPVTEPWLNSSR